MKRQTLAKGAVLLALCSILAKVLGGVYRISLTSVLGAKGIGYYQLVFPFFALMLAILANALPITLSKLISSELALTNKGAIPILIRYAMRYASIAGFVGMFFTIAISRLLAGAQSESGVYICYVAIAPAILFVCLAGVYKGWFLGHGNMSVVGTSQIIEVIAKLAIGLVTASYLNKYGIMQAVAGGLFAVSISEFICFLYIFIRYVYAKKIYKGIAYSSSNYKFFGSFLPMTLSGLVFPVIAFLDSIIIINLLNFGGFDNAVEQYGILTGPVNSVINMPIVLAMSVAVAIVPAIASALTSYDIISIKQKTSMSLKVCILIAFPFFIGGAFLSRQVVELLYPNLSGSDSNLAWVLLAVVSVNIMLLTMLEVFNAILQGLGRLRQVLVNVCVGGVIKILFELLLTPIIGIIAVAFSNIVFYLVAMLLNGAMYQKLVGHNSFLIKSISKICLSGVIMSVVVALANFIDNNILAVLFGGIAGGGAYVIMLFVTKAVEPCEIEVLPFGRVMCAFLFKIKLFRQKPQSNSRTSDKH